LVFRVSACKNSHHITGGRGWGWGGSEKRQTSVTYYLNGSLEYIFSLFFFSSANLRSQENNFVLFSFCEKESIFVCLLCLVIAPSAFFAQTNPYFAASAILNFMDLQMGFTFRNGGEEAIHCCLYILKSNLILFVLI